jgi:hypothetical protein
MGARRRKKRLKSWIAVLRDRRARRFMYETQRQLPLFIIRRYEEPTARTQRGSGWLRIATEHDWRHKAHALNA